MTEQDFELGEELGEISRAPRNTVDLADEHLILNGPVKEPLTADYAVPQESDFGSSEFMQAEDLAKLAHTLVNSKNALVHLKDADLLILWKRKGGNANGRPQLGKTSKASGLVRHLSGVDFVIWLAADHCTGLSKIEVEAVLFEQLCACGRDQEGNRVIVPPDVVTHLAVIREYGLVFPDLKEVGKAIKQLGLGL